MKKYFRILALVALCTSGTLYSQTWIPEDELSYTSRYSLEEALESEEPDSIFAISIWGNNYDPYYIVDSTEVSEDIFKFKNLQILMIGDHLASHVVEHLDRFPMLQTLGLYNVGIDDLPPAFYTLKHLKQLYLQDMDNLKLDGSKLEGNQLHELEMIRVDLNCEGDSTCAEHVEYFPHLKKFTLGGSVYHIPPGVFGLKEIEVLNFNACNFEEVPEEIGNLSTLEDLNLSGVEGLTTLPESFGKLKSLKRLDIGGCGFEYLPESIAGCTSLEVLYCSYGPLLEVPEWIGELTNLQSLNLSNSYISVIPASISNCKSLTSLLLYSNSLSEFPQQFFGITTLESLDLSNNSITTLPSGLARLTNLTSLDLSGNPIVSMAPDALNNGTISYLNLSRCGLKSISDLSKMTSLGYLDISDDSFSAVPASIFSLPQLRELNMNFNHLETLPSKGWEKMTELNTLSFSYNALKSLPKGINKCVNLYHLDATNNKLLKLPKGISKLESLSYLRLQGNKGIVFSKEIASLKSLSTLQVGPEDMTPENLEKLKKWLGEEKLEISEY